jgi:DNA-binding response OmpR family regulator
VAPRSTRRPFSSNAAKPPRNSLPSHPGEVLSRDRLLNEVWGYNYYGTTRTLDQVVVQLRKKLGDHGDTPQHLLTVHGVGYKLVL